MTVSMVLDLIFVIFALVMILIGMKRGFIQSVIHSAKWILAFVFAYLFGGKLGSHMNSAFLQRYVRYFTYYKVNSVYLENESAFQVEAALEKLPKFLLNEEMKSKLYALEGSGENLVDVTEGSLTEEDTSLFLYHNYIAAEKGSGCEALSTCTLLVFGDYTIR